MKRREFLGYASTSIVLGFISKEFFLGKRESKDNYVLNPLEEKICHLYSELDNKFNLMDGEYALLINGKDQVMYLVSGENKKIFVHEEYIISTGMGGFGNEMGSNKTPLGIHKIKEMYGKNTPEGTIFKGRRNTNEIAEIGDSSQDLITTRIMWLEGCEEINNNSSSRYIYIHGTPEESLLGEPVSHGCIRMKNNEIIKLFEYVKKGTYVNIGI